MRIAAFNVENLFDRARAFDAGAGVGQPVLDAFAEVNRLFGETVYTDAIKARMLELLGILDLVKDDDGPLAILRKIRGQLITRPRSGPAAIKAKGRADWVGWAELKTGPVNEVAMLNTARVIRDVGADVLAVVEAESRPVLRLFQETLLTQLGAAPYANVLLIDGNDDRGIDVGLMTHAAYPIATIRTHIDERLGSDSRVFSRDCPEYEVRTPSGARLFVLPNHFKSKFGGNDPASQAKRRAQANATAGYYRRLRSEGAQYIAILGDLNDTPNSPDLAALLVETDLRDVSTHPGFTEFEFKANNGQRGIGTFGLGNDDNKIDYLLLSPALFDKVQRGGIFRKGAWPGARPKRWETYPELVEEVHAASDHHAIWVDLDV